MALPLRSIQLGQLFQPVSALRNVYAESAVYEAYADLASVSASRLERVSSQTQHFDFILKLVSFGVTIVGINAIHEGTGDGIGEKKGTISCMRHSLRRRGGYKEQVAWNGSVGRRRAQRRILVSLLNVPSTSERPSFPHDSGNVFKSVFNLTSG